MRKWLLISFAAAFLITGCGNDPTPQEGSGFNIDPNGQTDTGNVETDTEDTNDEDTFVPPPDITDDPGAETGASCDVNADCEDGTCLDGEDFPRGFCSSECDTTFDCATDTICLEHDDSNFCAPECDSAADCRAGYACVETDEGLSACGPIPDEPETGGAPDGAPCEGDDDCAGGSCIDGDGWVDGYCTTTQCEDRTDCARGEDDNLDNRCYRSRQGPFCVRMCGSDSDCREGYECFPVNGGRGFLRSITVG